MKRVLVPLAAGFEEMEGIIIIDVLRRAGADVVVAGLAPGPILASRGTRHLSDVQLYEVAAQDFDMVVLPGGADGARTLAADPILADVLRRHHSRDAYIGAICAAPNVLRNLEILAGEDRFTLHPATLNSGAGGKYVDDQRIVRTRNIITSIGPGSAFEFALELVADLFGEAKRREVAGPMFLPGG
ncbi:MAG: DJ-1/PfpI family protein [bacterium]|nr:DJ-1/PfpI family protein [bacterium]